jgi:hypothetical protein
MKINYLLALAIILLCINADFRVPVKKEIHDEIYSAFLSGNIESVIQNLVPLGRRLAATNETVNLTNSNEILYYGPLKIGADTTAMQFIFDTGSDWLWVPTSTCSNCVSTRKQTIAAPDTTTSTAGGISYLDGSSVNGTIYTTSVTVGATTATDQKVLMVTTAVETTVSAG